MLGALGKAGPSHIAGREVSEAASRGRNPVKRSYEEF